MPNPRIAGTIRSKNPLKGAVEVLPERLYYAALKQPPPSHNILASTPQRDPNAPKTKKQIHFFQIDQELVYWNFFLDFGPLNLGQLARFCQKLNDKLRKFPVVCFYSTTVPQKRANAVFLICAWQCLFLKRSPTQAYQGFLNGASHPPTADPEWRAKEDTEYRMESEIMDNDDNANHHDETAPQQQQQQDTTNQNPNNSSSSSFSQANLEALKRAAATSSEPPVSTSQGSVTIAPLPPFHDASPVQCTYQLSVVDCLNGLCKAVQLGFWDLETFDVDEYEHFEQVENGDLNWLVPNNNNGVRILAFAGPSYERHVSPEGYCTLAPADYSPYFVDRKVDLVVRLNKKNYHEEDFEGAGIRHVEHFFVDGSCPSMKVLSAVLQDFESVPPGKAFAVHCKAGLGRTGTCVGAYLMKHYRFTAAEVIGWMRLCRPGCVIGPQQQFLQTIEARMWQAGASKVVPTRNLKLFMTGDATNDNNDAMVQQTPDSPRQRLTKDAVEGRAGQGESLLAARAGRSNNKQSIQTAIPTLPITPEPSSGENDNTNGKPNVLTPDTTDVHAELEDADDKADDCDVEGVACGADWLASS
mmetsp:Transcript_21920/g.51540  ORF Transcript_21920/g.51540 Transcript_21920/m.51540 type:complete len:584 (-) Transcript_21920:124-1875(-)